MDEKENKSVKTDSSVENNSVPDIKKEDKKKDKKKKEKAKEPEKGKKGDKNKKKDDKKEESSKPRKGPSKKLLEELRLQKERKDELDERRKKEREERRKQQIEEQKIIEEEIRLEEERKEKLKLKKKEKKQKLKEEGKLLNAKQKKDQQRSKELLEYYKSQGLIGGEKVGAPKKRTKKPKENKSDDKTEEDQVVQDEVKLEENDDDTEEQPEEEEDDGVQASWDDVLSDSDEDEDESIQSKESASEGKLSNSSSGCDLTDSAPSKSIVENGTIEEISEKINSKSAKMVSSEEENVKEVAKESDVLRSPVVCVLGHVDHGKTKILDKLKGTKMALGEAGAITQEIRATIVPQDIIRNQTRMVNDFDVGALKFPGLLVIDTPGHESFSNLRSRGSSLCDFAILVIDINQGIQQTTIESIKLLKDNRTPFIVALNKIDILYEWKPQPNKDIYDSFKSQDSVTVNDFERRTQYIIQDLNAQGLNAALCWENPDPRSYVSLVPTNAIDGDGMGNLISNLCSLCQSRLTKRIMFSEELQCTVLEVSANQGYGTTAYVVLVNGRLREGNTIIVAGTEGPIVTTIRSLHIQRPKSKQYDEHKEVTGTQGVMIAAKELDKAIAGFSLHVAHNDEQIDNIKEMVDSEFRKAMKAMKVKDKGVYVQASSIGALEALLVLFKSKNIPFSGIKVGPVVKKDVMKASAMLEHDPLYAVILAFNVKIEKDAQELADKEGIRIFSEPIIYHLVDRFYEYIANYKKKKQDEFRSVAVFPCKLKVMPNCIYNKRSPIVLGVNVESGVLRSGTPLCVISKESKGYREKEFIDLGIVTSLEFDHKQVEIAKKGVEVCIKIENINTGGAPKLFGRHFDETDVLMSKVSRESIDACKAHFRDDLTKSDWKVMAQLKRLFNIF